MRRLGGILAFLGVFAIGLDFVGRVPTFLIWIYNWGEGVAWGIKIALVVLGGLMFLLAPKAEDASE